MNRKQHIWCYLMPFLVIHLATGYSQNTAISLDRQMEAIDVVMHRLFTCDTFSHRFDDIFISNLIFHREKISSSGETLEEVCPDCIIQFNDTLKIDILLEKDWFSKCSKIGFVIVPEYYDESFSTYLYFSPLTPTTNESVYAISVSKFSHGQRFFAVYQLLEKDRTFVVDSTLFSLLYFY